MKKSTKKPVSQKSKPGRKKRKPVLPRTNEPVYILRGELTEKARFCCIKWTYPCPYPNPICSKCDFKPPVWEGLKRIKIRKPSFLKNQEKRIHYRQRFAEANEEVQKMKGIDPP